MRNSIFGKAVVPTPGCFISGIFNSAAAPENDGPRKHGTRNPAATMAALNR